MFSIKAYSTQYQHSNELEAIVTKIGKIGTYTALVIVIVLMFRYFLDGILKRDQDIFGGEEE